MARTQQISHKGKEIFFMDFSSLNNVNDINGVIIESIRHIPAISHRPHYIA